jgi:glycyl-tRNA synthetase
MIDCRQCRARARADQLIDQWNVSQGIKLNVDGWENEALHGYIHENRIPCPQCGAYDFTDVRKFNLMFKTYQGVTEDSLSEIYLRPETAQGIFVNYRNVQRTSRRKIPFGIGQIGKAFRNEITPGNFIFRTREFEQMELEFFCEPGTDLEWFEYWCDFCVKWLNDLGLPADKLRLRAHSQEELSFYSLATTDIEYLYPFGWGELWGIADRTDYDLKQHMEHAKEDLSYFDPEKGEKYVPYVVEPSLGVDRLLLAMLCEAYEEEELPDGEKRTVLRFAPFLAPVQVAVLPLSNKLREDADKVYHELVKHYVCEFDDRQSIGRRYRRQDEIGTPYCVTFDFDSLEDHAVTIRERDSMEQVRVPIDQLVSYFNGKFDLP